jgi:hypothetical protein
LDDRATLFHYRGLAVKKQALQPFSQQNITLISIPTPRLIFISVIGAFLAKHFRNFFRFLQFFETL